MYFTHLLTQRPYALYLPKDVRDASQRLVEAGQRTKTNRDLVPFRRQVDFWTLCYGIALARSAPPREGSLSSWGWSFVNTRDVSLHDEINSLIFVTGFDLLGQNAETVDDPKQLIDAANRVVGSVAADVLSEITSPEIRLTPLEKALALAGEIADVD